MTFYPNTEQMRELEMTGVVTIQIASRDRHLIPSEGESVQIPKGNGYSMKAVAASVVPRSVTTSVVLRLVSN